MTHGQQVDPMLSVRGAWKAFDGHPVLRGIDLDVGASEVVTLIGASGSGKSTLLRCINGLETVDAGQILLDGSIDVTDPSTNLDQVRRRVGIVFQSFNLFPHMSVIDNVMLAPRKVLGHSVDAAREDGMRLLTQFGLADKAGEYPDRLSGGQSQRVAIVRALAMRPELMLFDEITSALDPMLVGEVLDAVRALSRDGLTIVMATHEMAFAREVSSRVCYLHGGVVLESGDPSTFFDQPVHEQTKMFLKRINAPR